MGWKTAWDKCLRGWQGELSPFVIRKCDSECSHQQSSPRAGHWNQGSIPRKGTWHLSSWSCFFPVLHCWAPLGRAHMDTHTLGSSWWWFGHCSFIRETFELVMMGENSGYSHSWVPSAHRLMCFGRLAEPPEQCGAVSPDSTGGLGKLEQMCSQCCVFV